MKSRLRSLRSAMREHAPRCSECQAATAEFGEFEHVRRFGNREEIVHFKCERARNLAQLGMTGIGRRGQGFGSVR